MFGGMDFQAGANHFYNDLWSYKRSTKTWTLLPTGDGLPFPNGAEIRPTPRAFMMAARTTMSFLCIDGYILLILSLCSLLR
jgi:hypothetical protein